MKNRTRSGPFKVVSIFTLSAFLFQQILWAHPEALTLPEQEMASTAAISDEVTAPDPSFSHHDEILESTDFLQDTLTLESVVSETNSPENLDYEYERYSLEEALDLLRPEFASAVILDKALTQEDIEALRAHSIKEGIEIALIVLYGETVLLTAGSGDEITASPAAQEVLKKASFVSHTHPFEDSKEGPTGPDLYAAAGDTHYLLTQTSAYSYSGEGTVESISLETFTEKYQEATREETHDAIAVRQELNLLIAEQDRLNQIAAENRETWLAGGTVSYTSSLTASNVTTFAGSPYPYIRTGSSAATMLTHNSSTNQFTLAYNVTATGSSSGMAISFDNATTTAVETRDLSAFQYLIFGMKGANSKLKLKIIDANNNSDLFTLSNVSSSTERFWRIATANIVAAVDKTKIKLIELFVDQSVVASTKRTGSIFLRTYGLNTNAAAAPVVTSVVPAATNLTTLALSGTKEANTAIFINGVEVIARNASTAWSRTVNLPADGTHTFDIQTKNTLGKLSTKKTVSTIRDIIAPVATMALNSDALYTTSRTITLSMNATDERSGVYQFSYNFNGAAYGSWQTYAATATLTLPDAEGTNIVNLRIRDKAGNIVYLSKSIVLDTVNPSVSDLSGPVAADGHESVFMWAGSDATSGVLRYEWQLTKPDGSVTSLAETTDSSVPVDELVIEEGDYVFSVRAVDKAGNVSAFSSQTFTVDNSFNPASALEISVTSPLHTNASAYNFTVELKEGETVSTVSEPLTLAEGRNDFSRVYRDGEGRKVPVNFTVWLDTTPPVVELVSPAVATHAIYTLAYTVDGVLKEETRILTRRENHLSVSGQTFTVLLNAPDAQFNTDGLLVSHSGVQGQTFHYGYIFDALGQIEKIRVVERDAKIIGSSSTPLRFGVFSAGYNDGWNSSLFVNGKGVGSTGYNYWSGAPAWNGRGYDIAIINPADGSVLKAELFDVWGKGTTEADRMAAFLESVPEGYYALMSVMDEGLLRMTERVKLAIEAFGSAKIRNIEFRGSWALIGQKGAAKGTAIEGIKGRGESFVYIDSYDTHFTYYDQNARELTYDEYASLPQTVWMSNIQTHVGDDVEILAESAFGPSAYRKVFNDFYADSGFIRLWHTTYGDYRYVNDARYLAEMLKFLEKKTVKAVYYDARYPGNFIRPDQALTLKNKLVAQGFTVLNADQLASFLETAGPDAAVIMAQDVAPDTIFNPAALPPTEKVRAYLERGGTMLWFQDQPFFYVGHADGKMDHVGEPGAKRVVGVTPLYRRGYAYVDFSENFDSVPANWNFPEPYAVVEDGQLTLTGSGSDWSAAVFPLDYVSQSRAPRYDVELSEIGPNTEFLIAIEGQSWHPSYRNFAVRLVNGQFQIEQKLGTTNRVWKTAPYVPGKEYTLHLEHSVGTLIAEVYEKGSTVPVLAYEYLDQDWTRVWINAAVYIGHVVIDRIHAESLASSVMPITAQASAPVFDNVPPAGKISINGGALTAFSPAVTLSLFASDDKSGVTDVRFSGDGENWSDWESYAAEKQYNLAAANGLQSVFAQVRDSSGNVSAIFSDEIILYASADSLVATTTNDGAVLNYLAGSLYSLEMPGQYTLIHSEWDAAHNLSGGTVLFAAGGAASFSNQKLKWQVTPQGHRRDYDENGRMREITAPDGSKTSFFYEFDEQGALQKIIAKAVGTASVYDAEGRLLSVTQANGDKLFYELGVLLSAELANGINVIYRKEIIPTGTKAVLESYGPKKFAAEIEYDSEGQVTSALLRSGSRVRFEAGVPVTVTDTDGVESAYDFSSDVAGEIGALAVSRLDYIQHFDMSGNLLSIELPTEEEGPASAERFDVEDGKVRRIFMTDGSSIEFADGGFDAESEQITDGAVHFADGSSARYFAGKLVEIVSREGVSFSVTQSGQSYVADRSGSSADAPSQIILDANLNVTELTRGLEIIRMKEEKIDSIVPNCAAGAAGCEEARYFYYLADKTVVVQGAFNERPVLEDIPASGVAKYSVSTYDLTGQPTGIQTFSPEGITRVDFSYGKIRGVFACNLLGFNCSETFHYEYVFDSAGTETTVITETANGTVREYHDTRIMRAVTTENITTVYTYDEAKRLTSSVMTWRGRVLESFTYQYDDTERRTLITDAEGTTRIYDENDVLVGVRKGDQEFVIYHTLDEGRELTAQETLGPLADGDVRYSVFDKDNVLVYTEKTDGTRTEYEEGRIRFVWDAAGKLVQSYEYDEAGNPVKITLHRMREEFPVKIQAAREEVERQKLEALRQLADAEAQAVIDIQETFAEERSRLLAQRSSLESQRYQTQCRQVFCSEECETVEVPGVADAINQVNAALADLGNQEAAAYADLGAQVADARTTIDTEVAKSFEEIEAQEELFRAEIVRQELSPVIFHYYREILGRDPSEAEYNEWIAQTNFDAAFDLAQLKDSLTTSEELTVRTASVAEIKQLVSDFLNAYKNAAEDTKQQMAATFGLAPADLVLFSVPEAGKILDWLNSRSLHFGQSAYLALEALLESAGLQKVPGTLTSVPGTFTRVELAKRLILTDILTGVITPFEEGELLLSLFALEHVAALYGVSTQGLEVGFEDLAAFYAANSGHRIIAHINGNHYVIVTDIKDGKVTYIDPGAGAEGALQVMEVTREDFLKVWDGVALASTETADALIARHTEDPNLRANPPPRALTKAEKQEVRGAFFFFLIPFFSFIFSAVVTIAAAVVGVITTVAAAIGAVLAPILGAIQGAILGIVGGLEALAGTFLGFATSLLHTIPFIGPALSGVVGAVGNFAIGFVSGFLTTFASTVLSQTASAFIVSIGTLQFAAGTLESVLVMVGVPEKIAHYIDIGVRIVGAVATGNPAFIVSTLTNTAVTEIGPRLGLSPGLTQALSIATSALAGTITQGAFDPNLTVFQALKNAAPDLVSNFAYAGVLGIGEIAGLDPRLTAILGVPIARIAGALVPQNDAPIFKNVIKVIQDQILKGAAAVSVELLSRETNLSPFVEALTVRALTGGIDALLNASSPQKIFEGIFQSLKDSALSVARLGIFEPRTGFEAEYLGGLVDFAEIIREQGIAAAFEAYATGIFRRDSVESLYHSFGTVKNFVQDALDNHKLQLIQKDGQNFKRLNLGNGDYVDLDENLSYIDEIRQGDRLLSGEFAVDQFGHYGLRNGNLRETHEDGYWSTTDFVEGGMDEVRIGVDEEGDEPEAPWFIVRRPDDQSSIVFDKDGTLSQADLWSVDDSAKYTIRWGQIDSFEQVVSTFSLKNDAIVVDSEYSYRRVRLSDGSFQQQMIFAPLDEDHQTTLTTLADLKDHVWGEGSEHYEPGTELFREVTGDAILGAIDRSIIQLRGKSVLLAKMFKPLFEKGTLQSTVVRKAGFVGLGASLINLGADLWKTSGDPRLEYHEKVALNLMREGALGVSILAGLAGAAPGTILANPIMAIGGAALLGGGAAWFGDAIVRGVEDFFLNN